MTEPYSSHTTTILDLWLQRLSQKPEIDPLLLAKIHDLIQSGQAGSEQKIRDLIAAIKEKSNESH